MSQLQEIEIVIDPQGNVKAHVKGVNGKSCISITKEMFQLLGNQLDRQQLTDDYYRQNDTQDDWQELSNG